MVSLAALNRFLVGVGADPFSSDPLVRAKGEGLMMAAWLDTADHWRKAGDRSRESEALANAIGWAS
jgi:hypothetical protein